jgi:hypothetical protein
MLPADRSSECRKVHSSQFAVLRVAGNEEHSEGLNPFACYGRNPARQQEQ